MQSLKLIPISECPACLGRNVALRGAVPTIDPSSEVRVDLMACRNCDHWFHTPIPSQAALSDLYADGSEHVVPRGYRGTSQDADSQEQQRIIRLLQSRSGVVESWSYLEVGIGSGRLYEWVATRAKSAYGVEPGSWGRNQTGIVDGIADIPVDYEATVIVVFDVLEHVFSPEEMLTELRKRSADAGRIFVTVPNASSSAAFFRGPRWRMIRPFGHLNYFSRRSLEHLFKRAGWEIESVNPIRIGRATMIDEWHEIWGDLRALRIKPFLSRMLFAGKDQWSVVAIPRP